MKAVRTILFSWAALLALLALTIAASFAPLGKVLPFVSYGIAVTSGSTSREQWAAQPPERQPDVVIENVHELLELGWLSA